MAATPRNKSAKPEDKSVEVVYKLTSPDGREYRTGDRGEAFNLHRTAGYSFVEYQADPDAPTEAAEVSE